MLLSSGGVTPSGGGSSFNSAILRNADRAGIAVAVPAAAKNAPSLGSVTQSSNGDGDASSPTTTDVARMTISVDPSSGQRQFEGEVESPGTRTIAVSGESASDFTVTGVADGDRVRVDFSSDFTSMETTTTVIIATQEEVVVSESATLDGSSGSLTLIGGQLVYSGTYLGRAGIFICEMTCQLNVDSTSGTVAVAQNIEFIPGAMASGAACVGATCLSSTSIILPSSAVTTTMTTYLDDPDYLVGGIWIYAPDGAGPEDYEFGAFVDGNDPFTATNLAGLTGTASYAGRAAGVYTETGRDEKSFGADVSLTADFGADTISGMISDFHDAGDELIEGNPSLMLETANIQTTNFFSGDTMMTVDGGDFTGKWGGRFYGNGANATDHPGSVGGTFGGATADDTKAFLGVFLADKP